MINLKKYNISVEREAQRCNEDGEVSDLPHPRYFGNKFENNFITVVADESQLKIKTPVCNNVHSCYNKLEEITNVVLAELHNENELLWPCCTPCKSNESKVVSNLSVKFYLDSSFLETIQSLSNCCVTNNVNDMYYKLCNKLNKRAYLVHSIFGPINASFEESGINIHIYNIDFKDKCGFSECDLGFLVAFIFSCLLEDDKLTSDKTTKDNEVINYFELITKANDIFGLNLKADIDNMIKKYQDCSTYIKIFEEKKNESDFISYMLDLAKTYSEEGYNSRYTLKEYPELRSEAIVLIKDAISQGVDYDVLNPVKHMVEFSCNGKREIIIEGNKTNRDSYIFPFITDDKFYAKRVLEEKGLPTPNCFLVTKEMPVEDVNLIVKDFENKPVVIKPRNTNFGIGITVYPDGTSCEQINNAIEYARTFDSNVLLEEYVKGMEYRFLVINGKCLSVAYRRSASVVGDGKSSIIELINLKNKEPWHALTATPVKSDEPVVEFLKLQGLNLDSIPKENERIVLRKNSNCSTGGESIVLTDKMPERFKLIAEKAAKAFDAKICGIDIIIDNLESDECNIIEVNDMPGYSINEWPYEGKGERIGVEVLKLVNLIK
jgi:D-alanine-D-alanine ligase-like ATP-grasp enzyme